METPTAGRRGEAAAGVAADIQALANAALRALVEIELLGQTFPHLGLKSPQLHTAMANIAWLRDDLDGHGSGRFRTDYWPTR